MTNEDYQMHSLAALKSIDQTLRDLLALSRSKKAASAAPGVDLDGPHGNPEIKAKPPKDWSGDPMFGKRFSECPAPYLRLLAERYDYFASRETDPTKKNYNVLDAARARGWAARIEAGYKPPVTPASGATIDDVPTW